MKEKKELVSRLFRDGVITLDELLLLLSTSKGKETVLPTDALWDAISEDSLLLPN